MVSRNSKTRLIGVAAWGMAMVAAGTAHAQQVITAVSAEQSGPDDTRVVTTAGSGVATTTGGTDARALTDFGVNKVFASGAAATDVYASSAWLDSFTVAGTGMVRLSFTFTIDGATSGNLGGAGWNYTVAALRNDGWSLNGGGGSESTIYGRKIYTGDGYDTMILQRTSNNLVTRADMRDFDGFYNFADAGGGQLGNFSTRAIQGVSNLGAYYEIVSGGNPGQTLTTLRLYDGFFQRSINNGPFQQFGYDNVGAGGPQILTAYNNVKANYALLAVGGLCAGECEAGNSGTGVIDPFSFTLDFDLLAGSKFTLASWLYADDVTTGTVDFYNTAKVTGVTVSAGGSLTSASGALTALPGGGYGYPTAVAGVPEPATWAMMIMGFGMIGGTLRRRHAARVVLAG